MALYKLTENGAMNTVSGVSFIADPANRHWVEYLAWVDLGNTPDPADQPTVEELALTAAVIDAPIGARAWFAANPNAKLIWSMSVTDLVAEITALVDAIIPLATAGNRTKLKLLLTGITLALRVLVKRERLDI